MKIRIQFGVTAVATVLCLMVGLELSAEQKPNVVLFLVDDMGWMDSTPYGSEYYATPNMQRLCGQSMRFTDAYAVPLCSPTRATILTGQYSARHGVTSASGHRPPAPADASPYPARAPRNRRLIYANSKNYLDPKFTTLAEVLSDAGYRTGHFGKWHLGVMPEHWPDKHGFETTWFCTPDPGPPSYFSPYGVVSEAGAAGRRKVGNITDGEDGEYITDRLTDEAIKFIKSHREEPFYLNLWHYSVHGPWGHKQQYTARYAKKKDPRGEQRNPIMASMMQSVDESLGRILQTLDQLELTDNTLFIFYSDNGGNAHSNTPDDPKMNAIKPGHPRYEFVQDWKQWAGPEPPTNNAPLREGKGRIYEGGQRVPLMVRWPGRIEPGTVDNTIVGAIDLYPTILDALKITQPNDHIVDGKSFLPVLRQTGELQREAYFTWFPHLIPAVSVRQGDWKLIRRFEPHPKYPETTELYNLKEDLGESRNLAEQMPDKVKELNTLIDGFIQQTGALAPKLNPEFTAPSPTDGLVPRMCKVSAVKGAVRVEPDGRTPFLGTAQVRHAGPMTMQLRARSSTAGRGKVHWKTAAQDDFPSGEQQVEFTVPGDEQWSDVVVELPVTRAPAIVRVYLPSNTPVEIQSLSFYPADSDRPIRAWDFTRLQ